MGHYQEALGIQPDFHKALNNLRLVQAHKDRSDEVIASTQEGLIIHPDFYAVPDSRQKLLQKREN